MQHLHSVDVSWRSEYVSAKSCPPVKCVAGVNTGSKCPLLVASLSLLCVGSAQLYTYRMWKFDTNTVISRLLTIILSSHQGDKFVHFRCLRKIWFRAPRWPGLIIDQIGPFSFIVITCSCLLSKWCILMQQQCNMAYMISWRQDFIWQRKYIYFGAKESLFPCKNICKNVLQTSISFFIELLL